MFSASLIASSVLVAVAGKKFKLPGGIEMSKSSEEIINKTGMKFGNEISHSVLRKKLIQANIDIQPEYFTGLQYALSVVTFITFLPLSLLGIFDFYWAVFPSVIVYLIPGAWLNSRVKKRIQAITADIPDFCILLGTALSSGADLRLALEQVALAMKGELTDEIRKALNDMATGDSRAVALNKMSNRCSVPELTGLVRKLQQAMRYGGKDLEPVVRHHAEKMQSKQRHEIQKVAGELTIKLLFPIIIFVFFPLLVFLMFPVGWNLLTVFD